jgi:hypothetical protein
MGLSAEPKIRNILLLSLAILEKYLGVNNDYLRLIIDGPMHE